jgi:hypothetical protein
MQPVLSAPGLMLVGSRASARASVKVVRRAEWIIFAFLLYAPALTFFVPTPAGVRTRLAPLNLVVIVSNAGLVCFGSAKLGLMLEVIRDGLPLGMVLLAYREMGWLGLLHQPLFEIAILIAIATVYGTITTWQMRFAAPGSLASCRLWCQPGGQMPVI